VIKRRPILFLMLFVPPMMAISPCAVADDATQDAPTANRLVNLDTAGTAGKGAVAGSLDVRFLSHPDDIAYTSLNVRFGLTPHVEAGIRAVTGANGTRAADNGQNIRYGGSDVEIYAKYGLDRPHGVRLAVLGGVSFPSTPAQNQVVGTLSGIGELPLRDRVTAYLNPRAVFLNSNTIVGVGVGVSIRVSDRVHIVGDWTPIASGDNTVSTSDGTRKRGDVWGVAVRFTSGAGKRHFDLDLGYSNATGSTTGFSLTPGLGNSAGFYFALRARP
jgi:hypothetical protein